MSGLFITGTGTGIGKTYLTQRLLQLDRLLEKCLTASKPIISGWPQADQDIQRTDTGILLQAQQKSVTQENIAACSPWRYTLPLTPSMAAQKEGKIIDQKQLNQYCQKNFADAKKAQQIHLMEGVGGVMAPIGQRFTVLDWLEQLHCPCILVTGSYLGTLSHTLTAIAVLKSKGLEIMAVLVNETPESNVSLNETKACLQEMISPIKVMTLTLAKKSVEQDEELIAFYNHIVRQVK